MKNVVPIVFSISNNYVKQCATTIISIIHNSNKNNLYEFDILSCDLTKENIQKFMQIKNSHNNIKFNFINMNNYIESLNLDKLMSIRDGYNYISKETYFRFFIPDIFYNYDKIIYLDADLIVRNDISNLFNNDIEKYYAGAVKDAHMTRMLDSKKNKTELHPNINFATYITKFLKLKNDNYFNAGVLLLNLNKLRKDNIQNKLYEFAYQNSPLEYQDQDVLNAVLGNSIKYLEPNWNVLQGTLFPAFIKRHNEFKNAYKDAYIFHFISKNKPWIIHHAGAYKYTIEWFNFYKQTPFYNSKDDYLLEHAKYHDYIENIKNYFQLKIFNTDILEVINDNNRIKVNLLNLIKIKTKKRKK